MSYEIQIGEEQRLTIQKALGDALERNALGGIYLHKEEREELALLHDLFRNLPQEEQGAPGALHGFTL